MTKVSQKRNRLPVEFTINNVVDADDTRFLAITIDVLHTGLNFNGSIFPKEVVNACADSIFNTPVLAYIETNPDGTMDFKGHEYKEIEDANGVRYVYAGSAYGVIPESCNYRWIEKVCSDGVLREFFQVDALLWTRFEDAIDIFNRDGKKPHSMELELSSITGEENEEDGTFVFSSFRFNGCCLLSSTDEEIQPAMIDSEAALANFTADRVAAEIKKRLSEYTAISVSKKNKNKEDETMPEKDKANFTLNLVAKMDEIVALLAEKTFRDEWGWQCARYYFVEVQDNEVIVMDREDHWRLKGIQFTEEGDKIKLDFDSIKRKKATYVDLEGDSGETASTFEKAVGDVTAFMNTQIDEANEAKTEIETNYTALKAEYDEMKPKYEAYVADAEKREKETIEAAKDAEFQKFDEHLEDDEAYAELKQNRDQYTLEDIQGKCAVLFTKKNLNKDFSRKDGKKEKEAMTANVFEQQPSTASNSRYGTLPTKKN